MIIRVTAGKGKCFGLCWSYVSRMRHHFNMWVGVTSARQNEFVTAGWIEKASDRKQDSRYIQQIIRV